MKKQTVKFEKVDGRFREYISTDGRFRIGRYGGSTYVFYEYDNRRRIGPFLTINDAKAYIREYIKEH